MTITPVFSLATEAVHLVDRSARRYELDGLAPGHPFDDLTEGHLVSVFSYASTWDNQERHPAGDELVFLLDGDAELLTDRGRGRGEQAHRLARGDAFVVPAGTWHRVAPRTPATLLFVTPAPAATEHRPVS